MDQEACVDDLSQRDDLCLCRVGPGNDPPHEIQSMRWRQAANQDAIPFTYPALYAVSKIALTPYFGIHRVEFINLLYGSFIGATA